MADPAPLYVVDSSTGEILDETPGDNARPQTPIPQFEGRHVESATMKLTGQVHVAHAEDIVVSVDDVIRVVGEFRVVGVRHFVDPKTGKIIREQVIRAVDESIELTPWDPSNPDDDGVVRAQ